jgi:hypothetical protein
MSMEIVLHRIQVRRNGKRFGSLWVGKRGVQWKSLYSQKVGNITWKDFDGYMKERAEKLGQREWKED